MTDSRRVRTVRLTAKSPALVRRGALLLEDALRTASLPEGGSGRVTVVRSLPVGMIRADLSPATLALTLERRVREHLRDAAHAADPSAASRDAVHFRDAVEPFLLLASRLARQEPVDAWFWPLAVPGFGPGLSRDEALRLTLFGALGTEPGAAAGIALVAALHERGSLDALLGALRWEEGPRLARAFLGAPPVPPPEPVLAAMARPGEALPPALRRSVARWVATWGSGDARSVWLAAVALCLERPARRLDPTLPDRAVRALATIVAAEPAAALSRAEGPRTPEPLKPDLGVRPGAPEPVAEPPAIRERTEAPSSAEPGSKGGSDTSAATAAPSRRGAAVEAPAPEAAQATRPAPPPPSGIAPELPEPQAGAAPSHPDVSVPGEAAPASAPAAASAPEPDAIPASPRLPEGPLPTELGGLLFLVPVFEHLGLAALLESHPHLIELDFSERLFGYVAHRLRAPTRDPFLFALGGPERAPLASRCPFVLPATFRERAVRAGPSLFASAPEGRQVELDPQGRIPLAVRRDPAPGPTDGAPAPARIASAVGRETDLALLLRAFLLGARRVCRRRAGLGLRELVCRPGRVVATRTHIDVLLDHRQADLRVRRAGLDLDPGWVPWLGRVIRYHYLYGELDEG